MVDPGFVSLIELGVLTVGVTIAVFEIRNMRQTRRAELFTQLYRDWRRPEQQRFMAKAMQMKWTDYDDFITKYSSIEHMDERLPYTMSSTYFNMMGILVREGLIDIDIVTNFLPTVPMFWEKFKPIILEHRDRADYPQYFTGVEYLYNEYRKLRGHQ